MPKRSAADKIEYYAAKIQKLKNKNDKKRKRRVIVYSSDSDENSGIQPQMEIHDEVSPTPSPTLPLPARSRPASPLQIEMSPPSVTLPCVPTNDVQPLQEENTNNEPEVEPELLLALGDASEDIPVYGPDINKNLAQRWIPILEKGLDTVSKEKLLKEQLIPDNCRLLRAPVLNPEIAAAVTDIVRNRDKKLATKQDQLGLGITAINRAMSLMLTGDDKVQAIKILSDGCRLLTDLHHTETELRKKLITPGLEKSFLTVIQDQARDESLFGVSLSDKIKASKTIERHGLQIKKPSIPKPSTSNTPSTSAPTRYQGNWSGPPRFQPPNRGRRTTYRGQYSRARQTTPPRTTRSSSSTSTSNNKRARQSTRR